MLRYACLIAVTAASGLFAAWHFPTENPRAKDFPPGWLDSEFVAKRTKMLATEWESYQRFCEARRDIFAALARGEICLCQACDSVYCASVVNYPAFVRYLQYRDGANVKEKITSSIIDHFEALAERDDDPWSISLAEGLQSEFDSKTFRSWCAEAWETCPNCPHVANGPGSSSAGVK